MLILQVFVNNVTSNVHIAPVLLIALFAVLLICYNLFPVISFASI